MDIYVLNQNFSPIAVIDMYKSLIWTVKYFTCGDFELYLPAAAELMSVLQKDNFIIKDGSDTVMVIEKVEIETSLEDGDFLIVSGRSAESLLDRRIVWNQTTVSASPPAVIAQLITENVITVPERPVRQIAHISIGTSDTVSGTLKAQYTGANLLSTVEDICRAYGMGIKAALSSGDLAFSCYVRGVSEVELSTEFDNLVESKYTEDHTKYRNAALVAGEGEGTARKRMSITENGNITPAGLARRELYVDARDISSNDGAVEEEDYMLLLVQRGKEKLAGEAIKVSFDCEVEPSMTYKYGVDYQLGDIVTVKNSYGIIVTPRITAVTESYDTDGYKMILGLEA